MNLWLFCCFLQILTLINGDDGVSTIVLTKDDLPKPTNCPAQFEPSQCDYPPGPPGPPQNQSSALEFDFKSIKWIENNWYEVMIEFNLNNTILRDNLVSVNIMDLQTPDNYLPSINLYTINSTNLVGEQLFHFFFKWVMLAKHFPDVALTCTTPFQIEYEWNRGKEIFRHGCQGSIQDIPSQCWIQCFKELPGEPETITWKGPELAGLPEGTECPSTFSDSCSLENREYTPQTFEFVYIHHISDDLYEVMLEFKTDENIIGHPKNGIEEIIVDYESSHSFQIYNYGWDSNPVGDSPYHFFLVWVMKTQQLDEMTCTTSFKIHYEWKNGSSTTIGHGCEDEVNAYPIQCWEEVCELENISESPIIITETGLPEPIMFPSTFSSGCELAKHLQVLEIFEFKYIHLIENDLYEVMLEFKIDSSISTELQQIILYPIFTLEHGNKEIVLFGQDINLVGNFPYHFFIVWTMQTTKENNLMCTSEFEIVYKYTSENMGFGHGCKDGLDIYPLQCWEDNFPEAEESTKVVEETNEPLTGESISVVNEESTAPELEGSTEAMPEESIAPELEGSTEAMPEESIAPKTEESTQPETEESTESKTEKSTGLKTKKPNVTGIEKPTVAVTKTHVDPSPSFTKTITNCLTTSGFDSETSTTPRTLTISSSCITPCDVSVTASKPIPGNNDDDHGPNTKFQEFEDLAYRISNNVLILCLCLII